MAPGLYLESRSLRIGSARLGRLVTVVYRTGH